MERIGNSSGVGAMGARRAMWVYEEDGTLVATLSDGTVIRRNSGEYSHWETIVGNKHVISNTAEELWVKGLIYFDWCDKNPIRINRLITSGKMAGTTMIEERPRPYTIRGLCLHIGVFEDYLRMNKSIKDRTNEFYIITMKLLYIIYVQNFEYTAVGVFSANFMQGVLGMNDYTDDSPSEITINVVQGLPSLSNSEVEVLEKMEFGKGAA